METQIIAYCGLNCSTCPAYVATQTDDFTALEQIAAQWREEFNTPSITAATIICDGCLSGDRKCSHCAECNIRACGIEHGVANCAYCTDYSTCDKIQGFIGMVPDARNNLEVIRLAL